jgi:hypothetical protein
MRENYIKPRVSVVLMLVAACLCAGLALSYPNLQAIGQLYGGPPPTFIPPLTVPTDSTSTIPFNLNFTQAPDSVGIVELKSFPQPEELGGPTDFIVVKYATNTDWHKDTSYLATLKDGQLLVGVRKPSRMGMVRVPLGMIALSSDADALISYTNGVLRIANLDAVGTNLKVNLNAGPFSGNLDPIYSLSPGFELVAGEHVLTREEIRPNDGILRRKPKIVLKGYAVVSQFQEESVLRNNAVVAEMNKKDDDPKSKRMISDMSRMAAVLNQVHGVGGFTK